MDMNKTCKRCGNPIGPDAPGGYCPVCLMKIGLASVTGQTEATYQGRRFEPPSVADLSKLFPGLEVLELIGRGGMGAVYKARQKDLDRLVALKILAGQAGEDPGFAERFTREARALARLSHPHIVAVYDFGQVAELHYFIMEYVDGTDLRQVERTGGLSASQALAIIPQICEALQFAHSKGIVHRDIKPENILLDREGNVKIADFGLVKILTGGASDLHLTQDGHVMGTPHYMAPEQVEHPQEVDHRADIYSLGVVFYEMLTGELPLGKFALPSQKVQVDVRLDEVVLRALEKEPGRRYQQASQVKTDVETIARTEAGPASTMQAAPRYRVLDVLRDWRAPAVVLVFAGVVSSIDAANLWDKGRPMGLEFLSGACDIAVAALLWSRRPGSNMGRTVLCLAAMAISIATLFVRVTGPAAATPDSAQKVQPSKAVDFNDPGFWRAQISRHLDGVRTLDCVLTADRLTYGADPNTHEKRSRYQFSLKWDRDHKWIDCSGEWVNAGAVGIDHIVQGSQYGWYSRSGGDWIKVKAGSGGTALAQFSTFGEFRGHPYEHAFSVAKGILCSETLQRTQAQGAGDWSRVTWAHGLDRRGRHVLRHSRTMSGPDGQSATVDLVLLGAWEQGAFKLLELRQQCQKLGVDLLYEEYSDHLYADGLWVPRQAVLYDWITPEPDAKGGITPQRLREKTVVAVQTIVVNQPMTGEAFDGFKPPTGAHVVDEVAGTHYLVWPDLAKITAAGGKDRVSVSGRVYLDGRPQEGVAVSTATRLDRTSENDREVRSQTDPNGQFELVDLVPGFTYRINAQDSAGHTAEVRTRLSELGEDLKGLKIDMTSGLTVTGTVTDPNGRPIAKALVEFRGKPVVTTDSQGRYVVHGLYADQGYEVEAAAKGYAPLDPEGEVVATNFRITLNQAGAPEPFEIVLQKQRVISGRVLDPNNQPVQGMRVFVVRGSPVSDTWKWYETHTDADGGFRIGNLGDRIYGLSVSPCGNTYHSPQESPLILRVTADSLMPDPLPGRSLVAPEIVARIDAFERPYRPFFRLKEYREASSENSGAKLIGVWLGQIKGTDKAKCCEALARLGSVPAYSALHDLEVILGGRVIPTRSSSVRTLDSSAGPAMDPRQLLVAYSSGESRSEMGPLPQDLANCRDRDIVCLALRAVARIGFAAEHAGLLIDRLADPDQSIRDYAHVALAELTGIDTDKDEAQWQAWLVAKDRSSIDSRGPDRLFASLCRVCREHGLSRESIEQAMAAWQGASSGAASFRDRLAGPEAQAVWQFLAAVDLEGDNPVQMTFTRGYWPGGMFSAQGHRNHDLKIRFNRECSFSGKTFKPGVWYVLPALFRDGYQGLWEIVDLRLDDLEPERAGR